MNRLVFIIILSLGVAETIPGQSLFQKRYSFNGTDLRAFCVRHTSDNGFISAGEYGSSSLIIKTDSSGVIQWSKYCATTVYSMRGINAISEFNGSFIVAGSELTNNGSDRGIWMAKFSQSGSLIWTKSFSTTDGNYLDGGANGLECAFDKYAVIGESSYTRNMLFVETDSLGNILHKKSWGCPFNSTTIGWDLKSMGPHEGYIIVGQSSDTADQNACDIYLMRIDSGANILWTKAFYHQNWSRGTAIQRTYDNGFIIAGNMPQPQYNYPILVKTDSIGNVQWAYKYNFNTTGCIFSHLCVSNDSGYVLSTDNDRGVLFKTDKLGNVVWAKSYNSGSFADYITNVDNTGANGYIVSGVSLQTSNAFAEMLLIKTDANGSVSCNESNVSIARSPITFSERAWGNENDSIFSVGTLPQAYSFAVSVTNCNVGLNELNDGINLSVYPNPLSSFAVFETEKEMKNATLTIYNSLGEPISQTEGISGTRIDFQRGTLCDGMYFYTLKENDHLIGTGKLEVL